MGAGGRSCEVHVRTVESERERERETETEINVLALLSLLNPSLSIFAESFHPFCTTRVSLISMNRRRHNYNHISVKACSDTLLVHACHINHYVSAG